MLHLLDRNHASEEFSYTAESPTSGRQEGLHRARLRNVLSGGFMALLAYYVPYFFITPFAKYVIGTSADLSFYLLAIVNAASFPGRPVPGFVADKLGALPTLAFSMAAIFILILCWIPVQSNAGTIVWVTLFGFFSMASWRFQQPVYLCYALLRRSSALGWASRTHVLALAS
ncbi:hypothetical protein M409DRAFT_24648 [Zasmidium cellare ATCC 36951]|uniref:Major facilitator superfamily (MFS) profile domain-containing protein n=1 Tax=Zasmidium cellare ATCC 36951 TaxID=1080233 RepID=A0A6A6CDV2_ZASCE|nr:uncharacterized protein M409DRAFT_24648 [Zasmidium cellare ATCC 36951]KAF2165265.1 hypothetical protein M409DRAFT_24648 [Zasmidium cellare ATCC 36951]